MYSASQLITSKPTTTTENLDLKTKIIDIKFVNSQTYIFSKL